MLMVIVNKPHNVSNITELCDVVVTQNKWQWSRYEYVHH